MTQLKAYSLLTDDVVDLGIGNENFDEILELGSMAATGHDNLVVFVDGPVLQQWKGLNHEEGL